MRLASARRPRRRAPLGLWEALDDVQWDYLMFGVQPTHGPVLHRGVVTWPRHTKRHQGWAYARARPRRKGLRSSWRWR